MRYTTSLLVALAIAVAAPAHAQEPSRWYQIGSLPDGTSIHMDGQSVRARTGEDDPTHQLVWTRMEHPTPQTLPNSDRRYTTVLVRYEMDCLGRRFRTLAAAFQFNGQPVHQETHAPETVQWESRRAGDDRGSDRGACLRGGLACRPLLRGLTLAERSREAAWA